MSVFWFFGPFLIIFFIVQSFKNKIWSKILNIQIYNIVRHWFSSKNWIFAIFFKKVSIDGFTHYLWKILLIFIVQSFKNEISSKILDTQKYNIVRHWFSSKNWIFSIFFKKVSIDGFTHFSSKIHPKFSKNRLFHIPQYIIYLWSEFYARSNNQTINFSDKNWETYEHLLIFWSIFWLFFLLSKVSKMKFDQKSLIYKNTTLYYIDFPQKIGFLRFFLRKFLLRVLHIIYGKNYLILLSKVSKMKFHQKSLIHKNTTLYDIDFPQKIGFLRFF